MRTRNTFGALLVVLGASVAACSGAGHDCAATRTCNSGGAAGGSAGVDAGDAAGGVQESGVGGIGGTAGADAGQLGSFSISLDKSSVAIVQGASTDVIVTLTPKPPFKEAVDLNVSGLPSGVTSTTATLSPGSTTTTITLKASSSAVQGGYDVTVKGSSADATASAALHVLVRGPAGSLDTTFANKGSAVVSTGLAYGFGTAVAVGPDDRIYVTGFAEDKSNTLSKGFVVVGLLPDGSPDPQFGSGGVADVAVGSGAAAYAIGLDTSGRVVVAGSLAGGLTIGRYLSDGSLDTAFGSNGVATAGGDTALGLVPRSDGSLIVGGLTSGTSSDEELVGLTASGALDSNFGSAGVAIADFGKTEVANGIALAPDGKVVAAGATYLGTDTSVSDFAVARFGQDGSLDASFGIGGKVTTDFGGTDSAKAVVVQANGRVVVGGATGQKGTSKGSWALARYGLDGSLDPSFGGGGKVVTLPGAGAEEGAINAMVLDSDGKLVVAGFSYGQGQQTAAVGRYLDDGGLDLAFGKSGVSILSIPAPWALSNINGVALQSDGRLVVAGWVASSGMKDVSFWVARLWM